MDKNPHIPKIFSIADLHLCISNPQKDMALLSKDWENYVERLERAWDRDITDEDFVLIPGDISWAMKLHEARADLEWIDQRPGKKFLSPGNHDYWWPSSQKKAKELGFSSITIVDKQVHEVGEDHLLVAVKGSEDPQIDFTDAICWQNKTPNVLSKQQKELLAQRVDKECERLERRLQALQETDPEKKKQWILMIHYPPTDPQRNPTKFLQLMQKYPLDCVVFGHLHSLKSSFPGYDFEENRAEQVLCPKPILHFTAADWLKFCPKQIVPKKRF